MNFDTSAICCWCQTEKLCDFVEDPFLSEVFPVDGPFEKNWWCEECYTERHEEV